MPVLLWAVLKYFNSTGNTPPSLLDIITVYGYSLFVYIPVAMICIFPWIGSSIDWVAIAFAMLMSGSVLIINFWKAAQETKKKWILVAIAVCHSALSIALKVYFFKHTTAMPAAGDGVLVGNATEVSALLVERQQAQAQAIEHHSTMPAAVDHRQVPSLVPADGDVATAMGSAAAAAAANVAITTLATAVATLANATLNAVAPSELSDVGGGAAGVGGRGKGGVGRQGQKQKQKEDADNDEDFSPMFKAKYRKAHNKTKHRQKQKQTEEAKENEEGNNDGGGRS